MTSVQYLDALNGLMVYVLTLVIAGQERSVLLRPIDPANGVILDDVKNNGWLQGLTLTGKRIEIEFSQVLMVEQYRVTRFNGQTTRSQTVSAAEVEKIIEKNTDPDTGEVKNIRSIEEKGNPGNRVSKLTDL